ncbi:unnamed protein product [Lactuca virosa]|uniref:Uncharacterized protein n=1 Tax=Lactuca virosa TaxID=75947 RepID=A0AAU9P6N2_9ASTR|nr:unnamed protein product [Lactuca virosa]
MSLPPPLERSASPNFVQVYFDPGHIHTHLIDVTPSASRASDHSSSRFHCLYFLYRFHYTHQTSPPMPSKQPALSPSCVTNYTSNWLWLKVLLD